MVQCQGSTSEANVSIQRQRPMTTSIRALLSCSDFVPCFHAILRVALLRIEFLHTNVLILLREFDILHQIGL